MNPFDLTGPEFLRLYVVVLVVAVVVGIALRWWLRRPGGEAPAGVLEHYPYEAAYLSGGAQLAVDAAIVRLIRLDVLTIDTAQRRLSRKNAAFPADAHPLERIVYQTVEPDKGAFLGRVRQVAARQPGVLDTHKSSRPGPCGTRLRRPGGDVLRNHQDFRWDITASAGGISHVARDSLVGTGGGIVPDSAFSEPAR